MKRESVITLLDDCDGHHVFFEHDRLFVADEVQGDFAGITLTPAGLRLLAKRINALADLLDGSVQ
jgi:hypothetical protein